MNYRARREIFADVKVPTTRVYYAYRNKSQSLPGSALRTRALPKIDIEYSAVHHETARISAFAKQVTFL